MKLKNIFIVFAIVLVSACESNEVTIVDADNLLLGNWVSPVYDEYTTTFTRNNTLLEKETGITFKQNGSLIQRTSGFCGTPPLTYFNVEGSFTLNNDIIIMNSSQNSSYFYGWKIMELTNEKLVLQREFSEQEKEHQALMDLFYEISDIVYSQTCSDVNDWSFVAYGAKACGGPKGYLPYHKSIDVASFLEKVATYTQAEKEFNVKWSITSDCAVVNPPKGVDCQFEYPILMY